MKAGYCNGSDMLVKVGGVAVGSCTSHTLTLSSETKERAVKPTADKPVSSGLWKGKGVTGLSYTIKAEGLHFYDETEFGYKDMLAAWKAGRPVEVSCLEREEDETPYLKGNCVITSLELTAPAQDDTSYNLNLENDGEPTILDASKITKNTEES